MKSKYELKNYQQNTVDSVSSHLIENKSNAAIVKSPTGSGKTIMATAIIETFSNHHGKDNTVVIWVSEDPNLNEQSKQKIVSSSDIYNEMDCDQVQYQHFTKFNAGKIYFINYARLGTDTHLNKGTDRMSGKTLWQRLKELNDSEFNVLLMTDEAHKGTSKANNHKSKTIIKKIMEHLPDANILGISATPNNSGVAMRKAGFDVYFHEVDKHDVVDEGMIKEKIVLNFTEKKEEINYELIASAVAEYDVLCSKWQRNGVEEPPLMLVQIPNLFESKSSDMGELIKYLTESKRCGKESIYHCIPGEGDITINPNQESEYTISGINANDIPFNNNVRFVIFKETLSEGWDCPRAEILLSLKNKKSETAIEQTVGRLLRNSFLDRPHVLEANPELNKVFVFTNGYNEDTLKLIQDSFSGEIESESIDAKTIERVELKHDIKTLFESLKLKHYRAEKIETVENSIVDKIKKIAFKVDENEGYEYDDFIDDTEDELAQKIVHHLHEIVTLEHIDSIANSTIHRQEAHILDEIGEREENAVEQRNIHIPYLERKLKNHKIDKWILDDIHTLVSASDFSQNYKTALHSLKINPDTKSLVMVILYAAAINDLLPVLIEKVDLYFTELFDEHNIDPTVETRRIVEDEYHPEDYSIIDSQDIEFSEVVKGEVKKGNCTLKSNKAGYERIMIHSGHYISAQQFRIDSTQEAKVLESLLNDNTVVNVLRNNPRTGLGIKYRDKSNKNALFYPDFIAITNNELILVEPKSIKIDDNFEAKYRETLDWLEDNTNEHCKMRSIWYVVVKKKVYKIDIEKEKSMLGAMRSEDAWTEGKIGERVF